MCDLLQNYRDSSKYTTKCVNFELCGEKVPDGWFSCCGKQICGTCLDQFGTQGQHENKIAIFNFKDKRECISCKKTKRCFTQPKCKHLLCLDCGKKTYYGLHIYKEEPVFPEPDIEHEYLNPDSFVRWDNYPSVKKYEEEWDKWDAENQHLGKLSLNSGNCPYCKRCNRMR